MTFTDYPFNNLRNKFGAHLTDKGFNLLNRWGLGPIWVSVSEFMREVQVVRGGHTGQVVSALDFGTNGLGQSPDWGTTICLLARRFIFFILFILQQFVVPLITPRCMNGTANCWDNLTECRQGSNLQWTRISTRGRSDTPGCFVLKRPELSTGD